MPTEEQTAGVVEQIEKLQSARYGYPDEEGLLPTDMAGLLVPGREGLPWDRLPASAQDETLYYHIDWEGFTETQRDDVIKRVVEGQDAEWMDGIKAERALQSAPAALNPGTEFRKLMAELWEQNPAARTEPIPADFAIRFIEYELDKLRGAYFDDGSSPMRDGWRELPESTKLSEIFDRTNVLNLGHDEAVSILTREINFSKLESERESKAHHSAREERQRAECFGIADFDRELEQYAQLGGKNTEPEIER